MEQELGLSQMNVKELEKEINWRRMEMNSTYGSRGQINYHSPVFAEDSNSKDSDYFSLTENGEIKYGINDKTLDFNYDDPDFPRT